MKTCATLMLCIAAFCAPLSVGAAPQTSGKVDAHEANTPAITFLSDSDPVYMYLETLQEFAYEANPKIHRWADSAEDEKRMCAVVAELDFGEEGPSGHKVTCEQVLAEMRVALPTRYEDANSMSILRTVINEVKNEIPAQERTFLEPHFGTLPTGTLNARALRPLGATADLVVVNQSLFPFVHELSKIGLATIPVELEGDKVSIRLDDQFFEKQIRKNTEFVVRFSKALEDFANDRAVKGQAAPRKLDLPLLIVLDGALEDFVVAHEFAHLVLHHQTYDQYKGNLGTLSAETITQRWGEEALADLYAAEIINRLTVIRQNDPDMGVLRGDLRELGRYAPVLFFIFDRIAEEAHYIHQYHARPPQPTDAEKAVVLGFLEDAMRRQVGHSSNPATSGPLTVPEEVTKCGDHPPAWAREMVVRASWSRLLPAIRDPVDQSFESMAVLMGRHLEILWDQVAPIWVKIVNKDTLENSSEKPSAQSDLAVAAISVTPAALAPKSDSAGGSYASKARAELNSGDYVNAVADATRAIAEGMTTAHFTRGRANLGLRRYSAAARDFSLLISKDDSYYWNRGNRAIAYAGLGESAHARHDFDSAFSQGGAQDGLLLMNYGEFLLKWGDANAGVGALRRSVMFEPDNAEFLADLAEGMIYIGDYSGASDLSNRILEVGDRDPRAAKYRSLGLMFRAISLACSGSDFSQARGEFEAALANGTAKWNFDILNRWLVKTKCPKGAKSISKQMIEDQKRSGVPMQK